MASSQITANGPPPPNGPSSTNPPNQPTSQAPAPAQPVGSCIQCNSAGEPCHPNTVGICERCDDHGLKCSLKCWYCEKNHKVCDGSKADGSCSECGKSDKLCVPGPLDRTEAKALREPGTDGPPSGAKEEHERRKQAGLFGPRAHQTTSCPKRCRRHAASGSGGASGTKNTRKRKAVGESDDEESDHKEPDDDKGDSSEPGPLSSRPAFLPSTKNRISRGWDSDADDEDTYRPGRSSPRPAAQKQKRRKKEEPEILMNDPIFRRAPAAVPGFDAPSFGLAARGNTNGSNGNGKSSMYPHYVFRVMLTLTL